MNLGKENDMSNDIALTSSIRNNLLSLQNTQRQLDTTQLRLSTGRKVNSALDDPNAFFAAQGLTARADDLSRLLDGIGQAIQTLEAADNGITALVGLLEQAESIATTARDQASGAAVDTSNNITAAEQADVTLIAGVDNTDQFTLQAGTNQPISTFTINTGDSLADIASRINSTAGFSAQIVDQDGAGAATDRRLEIRTTNGEDLVTTDAGGALAALGLNVGTTAAVGQVPEDRVELEADYNEVLTQITELVGDTGYRGTNLLNGDSLTVQFNEDNSSTLTVAGVNFDATSLNINTATFDNDSNITASITEIGDALDRARSQARTFGSNLAVIQNRESFTNQTINTLSAGSDRLVLADLNEESARLLSLQTTQNLGITSLSLAAQAQQSVLRLF